MVDQLSTPAATSSLRLDTEHRQARLESFDSDLDRPVLLPILPGDPQPLIDAHHTRIHSDHHPRLAHLHEALTSVRSVLPPTRWQKDWSNTHMRLEDLKSKIGRGGWAHALTRVTDEDRELIHHLLTWRLGPVTAARDWDRFLLPLPRPDAPVIAQQRVGSMHPDVNARYADDRWPLAAMIENPSTKRVSISWRACPTDFREELRLVAWTMINGELRPTFVKQRGGRLRSRLSALPLKGTVDQWFRLAAWLEARGIRTLAECRSQVLHEYGLHLRDSGIARSSAESYLSALARLRAFDQICAAPIGVGRPPWDEFGADEYLPKLTTGSGENVTEPISEQTMGPLLVWSMRVIEGPGAATTSDPSLPGLAPMRCAASGRPGPHPRETSRYPCPMT
jgi:hypothetical protein